MRTQSILAGLAIAALFAASARADDKITFKLRPKKGDEYAQVMKMDNETKMKMGDKPMDMTMHMEAESSCKVDDVAANGTVTLKTTMDAMRAKMEGPMAMDYDSRKPETANSPMAKGMAAQLGKTITSTMGADGKIGKVEGAVPGANKQAFSGIGGFPDHPIGVGDAWDSKMDLGGAGIPMEMNVHYTLVERKGGTAKIKMDGTMDGRMEGTVKGTVDMDEATGMPLAQEMEMKMKMQGPGNGAAGPEITMKMTMTNKKK